MKNLLIAGSLLAFSAALPAAAQEQDSDASEEKVVIVELDDDAGLELTRDEAAKRAGDRFDRLDRDKDGYLSEDERTVMPRMHRMEWKERQAGEEGAKVREMVERRVQVERLHEKAPKDGEEHNVVIRRIGGHDPAKMFDEIDSDGDGMISREEFEAHHKDHPMPMAMTMDMPRMMTWEGRIDGPRNHFRFMGPDSFDLDSADANGDGKISRQEMIDNAQRKFDEADKDGNGTLSGDERREQMMARFKEIRID